MVTSNSIHWLNYIQQEKYHVSVPLKLLLILVQVNTLRILLVQKPKKNS